MARAGFENISRAELVHLIVFSRAPRLGQSGNMKDKRNILHRRRKRFGQRAVSLYETNIKPLDPPEMRRVPHQTGYGASSLKQGFHQMTADEAGASGDQNVLMFDLHHILSSVSEQKFTVV